MIGKQQIQITGTQIASGLCTSDYLGDGGMGVSSYNINPVLIPGVIRATPSSTLTGTLTDDIIASCEDPSSSTSTYFRILVDSSGNYYSCDDTSITNRVTAASGTGYTEQVTDMVSFAGSAYCTRNTDIAKLSVNHGSSWTVDNSWWVTTNSKSALQNSNSLHPLLVFEGFLWIGDDSNLHRVDSAGTITLNALALNSNERITSLGLDPSTGLMMIGVRTISDYQDYESGRNFIYLFDGYSAKGRRKVPVDGIVSVFYSVGGVVYVGMGNTIGTWNGAGVTFMRKLSNASANANNNLFKTQVTHVGNTLMIVDGVNVLAYGDIINGKRAWYPIYKNQVDSNKITFIARTGSVLDSSIAESPLVLVNFSTTTMRYFRPGDVTTVGTGGFYTNNINFERPVYIRGVRVFTTGVTSSNGGSSGIGNVAVIDENQASHSPTQPKFKVASGTQYVFDFPYGGQKLQTLQPAITLDTQAFGIYKIVIYYDVAE